MLEAQKNGIKTVESDDFIDFDAAKIVFFLLS